MITTTKNSTPVPVADMLDAFIRRIGNAISWVYVLLVLVIITQVILRKGFSSGLIVLEELQWHLYAVGVMFGLSYAQINNSHVRVDLIYSTLTNKSKRIIEIIGILTLVLPFITIVFLHSLDFVYESWRVNEGSESPSGLPWRWAIKSVIPASFALLGLGVISRLIRDVVLLSKGSR